MTRGRTYAHAAPSAPGPGGGASAGFTPRGPATWAAAPAMMALALLAAVPAAHANLVTNGGFDIAVPSVGTGGGWTATANDGNGGWRATGGNPGGYFIINAAGQAGFDPSIEQVLNGLTIGETYVVTGDFTNRYNCCNASGSAATLSFGVDITPGGLLTQLAYPGSYPNWYGFSTSFTATQASHTIRFTAERNGTDTEYAIDNISVLLRVPEPGSFAPVGLALLGLAGVRARQNRH